MDRARAAALLIAMLALLSACLRPAAVTPPPGVELIPLRSISTLEARALLMLTGVKDIPVARGVDCYRMIYSVRGADGRVQRMSGLLALPRGVQARRLVSFQHGTTTTPSAVPSNLDGTGLATAIVFGGNGYALIAPDYPGLGVSEGPHPYYVADAIAPSVTEMIAAAHGVTGVPDAPVFLAGFSEGGWASLAALRLLEAQGVSVLGSAQVAGAYDLRNIALPAALQGGARSHSLYLAYAAWGQAAHYGRPLDSVLTPARAADVQRLFNGGKPQEILDGLPPAPRDLFNAEFLDAFDQGGPHWLLETFAANSLTDVTPRAPVRLYYGAQDVDVPPAESVTAAARMRGAGADAEAIKVGPVGHDPSMLAAAPLILDWLAELEAEAAR